MEVGHLSMELRIAERQAFQIVVIVVDYGRADEVSSGLVWSSKGVLSDQDGVSGQGRGNYTKQTHPTDCYACLL